MHPILSGGRSFSLKEMDDTSRREYNEWHLQHGNHKSAKSHISKVRDMVHDEVNRGLSLPLPTASLNKKLPWCSLTPFSMVDQGSIDETGLLVDKSKLAHDLSLKGPSGLSVNARIIEISPPRVPVWLRTSLDDPFHGWLSNTFPSKASHDR
jgi:hypothetical protein